MELPRKIPRPLKPYKKRKADQPPIKCENCENSEKFRGPLGVLYGPSTTLLGP